MRGWNSSQENCPHDPIWRELDQMDMKELEEWPEKEPMLECDYCMKDFYTDRLIPMKTKLIEYEG